MFEIGNSLREARVRQGLDYAQIELGTKIRSKYIKALEDEQFATLPAQPYVKGFLRTYAEFLGLDGQLYVDEYNSRFVVEGQEDAPPIARRPPTGRARRDRGVERRIVLLALLGIAGLTALVIVAWKFGGSGPSTPSVVHNPPTTTAAPTTLRLTGVNGGTYVEVRRSSATGAVLLQATIPAGPEPGDRRLALLAVREALRGAARPARRQGGGAAGPEESPRRGHAEAHGARGRLSRPRALIVVTGSELVRGERTDLNGPFLAREALRLGLEPARITIVGDAPEELEAALREGLRAEACFVSGGLGPTHDDRTVEMVARAAGVGLRVDESLEREIEAVSRGAAERLKRPYADFAPGVTKQATLPEGARSLGLAGTAPGLLLTTADGCVVVVLPGPPSELKRLWPNALETDEFRALLARTQPPGRRVLRFFGVSESAVARALADAGGDGDGVEATICARDFEIHVDLVVEPGADARADALDRPAAAADRALAVLARRAADRGARAVALRGTRPDAGDGGVVHRRDGRLPADRDPGRERGAGRRCRRLRERGEGGRARRSCGAAGGARRRLAARSLRRWRGAPASGSAPTWRSR